MRRNRDIKSTALDNQDKSRNIDNALNKTATKYSPYAYNQCQQCLNKSQKPSSGAPMPVQPVQHPSTCDECKTLLFAELNDVREQQRSLEADLGSRYDGRTVLPGVEKKVSDEFERLERRRRVLQAQIAEPCSYSIPLQPYMTMKKSSQVIHTDRFDPRLAPHQYQGEIHNFGGPLGTLQWQAAQEVLRQGMGVMPGLARQKYLAEALVIKVRQQQRQRQPEKQRRSRDLTETKGGC